MADIIDYILIQYQEIEQKILSENRKILLRNAFLGKFDRSQMKEVDNAIAIVKEAKAETEKALEVGINLISSRVSFTGTATYSYTVD